METNLDDLLIDLRFSVKYIGGCRCTVWSIVKFHLASKNQNNNDNTKILLIIIVYINIIIL